MFLERELSENGGFPPGRPPLGPKTGDSSAEALESAGECSGDNTSFWVDPAAVEVETVPKLGL